VFTYYLKDSLKSRAEMRREKEKEQVAKGEQVIYPDWDDLRKEDHELSPSVILTVKDSEGVVIRRLTGPVSRGFHRIAWNLRYPASLPTRLEEREMEYFGPRPGPMVTPGTYSVSLSLFVDGKETPVGESSTVEVVPLPTLQRSAEEWQQAVTFQKKASALQRAVTGSSEVISKTEEQLKYILKSLDETPGVSPELRQKALNIREKLIALKIRLEGDWTIMGRSEARDTSIVDRIQEITGYWNASTSPPTATHRRHFEIASIEFETVRTDLKALVEVELEQLHNEMEAAAAPWTPGRKIPDWSQ
jgi:hypothetical protein